MRAFNQLVLLACLLTFACGFQVAPPACGIRKNSVARATKPLLAPPLQMADPDNRDNENVRVDLVEDVDSVTLTAIGFGLIAFNFLVLANMGDGGLSGLVARFINFWNS